MSIITISTGSDSAISLAITIRESAQGVGFQVLICIFLLAIFAVYFKKTISWMRFQMESELA